MRKQKNVVVLIPCHNEERGIVKVIKDVPLKKLKELGYTTSVIVIDNNSTDNTGGIAKKNKAVVIYEKKIGKGNAIRAGFKAIPKGTDFIVTIDGDNTYKASEIPRLIEPLDSGFADMIVGSRLSGRINKKSLKNEHKIVNWIFTFLVRHFYAVNTTDVLSGFVAFKKEVADSLKKQLKSDGFAIEMEMNIKASRLGYKIYSVPISYDVRIGESKLEGFKDALKILFTFVRYISWKPPERP